MSEKIIHRGVRPDQQRPNSFEAIRDQHRTYVECDVFLLADGSLGVVHNKDIGESQEAVEAMTSEDFDKLRVRDRSTSRESTSLPYLTEYVLLAFDRGTRLSLEIKASSREHARRTAKVLINALLELVNSGALLTERIKTNDEARTILFRTVAIGSFSPDALEEAVTLSKKLDVPLRAGLTWPSSPSRAHEMSISEAVFDYLERAGISFSQDTMKSSYSKTELEEWAFAGLALAKHLELEDYHPQESLITQALVDAARQHAIKLYAWVVNDQLRYQELVDMGVNYILTETV